MGRRTFTCFAAVIVILLAVLKLSNEVFHQLFVKRCYYFLEWVNWMELILYSCSIIFVSMPNWTCPCVLSWQWQVGVIAVLLAWFDFIMFTSNFAYIGIYVMMFIEICKTFLKLGLLTLLLIVTFGITFYMILSDPGMQVSSIVYVTCINKLLIYFYPF